MPGSAGQRVSITLIALVLVIGLVMNPVTPAAASPAVQGDQTYSETSTWNWFQDENKTAVSARCQMQFMGAMRPEENPGHAGCIVAAMRTTGASAEAIRFFETTHLFLTDFHEAGRIDLGHAGAPWSDMGRGEMVFLNGSPSVVPLGFALSLTEESWKNVPAYYDVRQRNPQAFPWPNHAGLDTNDPLPDGSQRFIVLIPLRDCRACKAVATMPVALTFDSGGVLVAKEILPPTAP